MTETSPEELVVRRLTWLESCCGRMRVAPRGRLGDEGPWVAVVCSRLGHDPARHRRIGRRLSRSVLDCRARGGTLLYAEGSAIAGWAERAAELFGVDRLAVRVGRDSDRDSEVGTESAADTTSRGTLRVEPNGADSVSRDRVLIALADRVDALYVRRGGKIERSLLERLQWRDDATTRVAISGDRDCGGGSLVADGAIGWYLAASREVDRWSRPVDGRSRSVGGPTRGDANAEETQEGTGGSSEAWPEWTRQEGEWLVHCTRGTDAAWPGVTPRQYLDAMLLGGGEAVVGDAFDTLSRIVRMGRLLAAAGASPRAQPVVCFSAVPLRELLRRRCYRPHLHRWDYEPYGVAIRSRAAAGAGVKPVIYGAPNDRETIFPEDRYRFQPCGTTYDWTAEREWRSPGDIDLGRFAADDVRVFVPNGTDAVAVKRVSRWPVTAVG